VLFSVARGRRIDEPSVEIRRQHLRVRDGSRIDRQDVTIEHDQIGALTDFEAAGDRVLLHGVGGVDGVGVDRCRQRNALVDIERRLTLSAPPGDANLEGDKRIVCRNIPVAAADYGGTGSIKTSSRI
jgi:hypothetical protein